MTVEPVTFASRLRALLHHPSFAGITAGVSAAIAVFVAYKMPVLARSGLRIRVGVQVGLYLLASLLVTRIVVLLAISRLPPRNGVDLALPLGRFGALRGRAAWVVPLAMFVVMTLMREGTIEPLAFDFTLSTDDVQSHWDSHDHYDFSTLDADRRMLSQLALSCSPNDGARRSEIERGFDDYLQCPRDSSRIRDYVTVEIRLHQPDVFCSVPLYRAANVRFAVNMSVAAYWGDGDHHGMGNGTVDVSGTIDVTSRGFMSCRHFNQMIGERIAAIAVERMNEFLRTN
jgi:hypothetical protein